MMTEHIRHHFGKTVPEVFNLQEVAAKFSFGGQFVSAHRFGNGHINDTFLVSMKGNPRASSFVLQRINTYVFTDPVALMKNIQRVTEHLLTKDTRCLALIPTIDQHHFYKSPNNDYWRAYEFVPGAVAYDKVSNTKQAQDAAAMFGRFQLLLADLPGPRLNETIPDFHNTPVRYSHLLDAVRADACDRVRHCREQIDRALAWEDEAGILATLHETGQIPERTIHNDTKLNNLLFDQDSGVPVCVVDLDTIMPGIVHYDFGDMVRTATSPTDEDMTDLSGIGLRTPYYEALVEGFISSASGFLTDLEIEHLSLSGKIITVETGLRFLTDYLCGDEYFGSQRPGQNLDRCRTQFTLAASIEDQFDEMQNIVNRVASRHTDGNFSK
jgi:Ser/Thr protein kinase RdoA (MazF antagonist)